MTRFAVQVSQNPYLARDSNEVHAVVSIAAAAGEEGGGGNSPVIRGRLAEAFIVDTSGSMGGEKIHAAIEALEKAIHLLHEDAMFCVIGGNDAGTVIAPLLPATAANKVTACREVRSLNANGGTAMSTWLAAAARELRKAPAAIPHALLLTDGRNESESESTLIGVLRECEGKFQCDARGVGTDWIPEQLRLISSKLLGTIDIIPGPADIEKDFQAVLESALGKTVADVSLRVWTPLGATVEFCKLVYPQTADLTDRARPAATNAQSVDFPTGAWGSEKRDYHLCIKVKPGAVGQKMCAGRVSLMLSRGTAEEKLSDAMVLAQWTDDETQSAVINAAVAHYTGQAELADTIQQGLSARAAGNEQVATRLLGRAVQIAADTNPETMKLLRKVVEIEDEKQGTVKLRKGVRAEDEFALDTRSTKTVRVVKAAKAAEAEPA
jgi:hypothetical protein